MEPASFRTSHSSPSKTCRRCHCKYLGSPVVAMDGLHPSILPRASAHRKVQILLGLVTPALHEAMSVSQSAGTSYASACSSWWRCLPPSLSATVAGSKAPCAHAASGNSIEKHCSHVRILWLLATRDCFRERCAWRDLWRCEPRGSCDVLAPGFVWLGLCSPG